MSQDKSQNTQLTTETTQNSSSVTTSTESENSCPDYALIDSTSHDLNVVQQPELHQQLSLDNIQQPNSEVYQENVEQIISAVGESSCLRLEESSDSWEAAAFPQGADALSLLDDLGHAFLIPGSEIQPQEYSLAGIQDLQLQADQPQQSIANAETFPNVELSQNEISIVLILSTPHRQQQTTLLNFTQTDHAGAQISTQQQNQDPDYPNKGHVLATATNPATEYTPSQSYLFVDNNTGNIADTAIVATPTEAPSSISHLIASQGNQSERNYGSKKQQCVCHVVGCHRLFDEPYQLQEHLRNYPHDKPYVCQFCGNRFHLISEYRKHRRTHVAADTPTTSTSIESASSGCYCSGCEDKRKDIEDKTKEHVCDFPGCNCICFTPSSVREHRRKHNGEKSFVCTICGTGFTRKKGLTDHQKTCAAQQKKLDAYKRKFRQNVATVTNPATVSIPNQISDVTESSTPDLAVADTSKSSATANTPNQISHVTENGSPHIVILPALTAATESTPNEISHIAESETSDTAVAHTSTTAATVSTPNQISHVTESETPDTAVAGTSTATTVTPPFKCP